MNFQRNFISKFEFSSQQSWKMIQCKNLLTEIGSTHSHESCEFIQCGGFVFAIDMLYIHSFCIGFCSAFGIETVFTLLAHCIVNIRFNGRKKREEQRHKAPRKRMNNITNQKEWFEVVKCSSNAHTFTYICIYVDFLLNPMSKTRFMNQIEPKKICNALLKKKSDAHYHIFIGIPDTYADHGWG